MKNINILVIDDEESILFTIERILKTYGFEVITAGGEKQALSILKPGKVFHLVISDLVLKETDGISLLGKIKKKLPKIKTILMSGCNLTKNRIDASAADYFLQKPFDLSELIKSVKKVLPDFPRN
ncbi:MAG: response regulator [bacterium]